MSPAEALSERVESLHKPGNEITLCTDVTSYPGKVLLAIRRPAFSVVLQIDATEWDAVKCAKACGWQDQVQAPAIERVKVSRAKEEPKPRTKKR